MTEHISPPQPAGPKNQAQRVRCAKRRRWEYLAAEGIIASHHCTACHCTSLHITSHRRKYESHTAENDVSQQENHACIRRDGIYNCHAELPGVYVVPGTKETGIERGSKQRCELCHAMPCHVDTWRKQIRNPKPGNGNPESKTAQLRRIQNRSTRIQKPAENGGINIAQTPVMNTSLFATAPHAQVKATNKKGRKGMQQRRVITRSPTAV